MSLENNNIIAYIECPPYPLTQLNRNEDFTIGRGMYNRLVLAFDNVSRYHSVIKWKNDCFKIEDLGSSNGTYVNDEILESEHILKSGDKIVIGDQLLTYRESQKQSSFQTSKTEKTDGKKFRVPSVEEIKTLRTSLQGNIETIPLFSILQLLAGDQQTGCLEIKQDSQKFHIYFKEGNVIHANFDDIQGENAFFQVLKCEKGEFQFLREQKPSQETMNENLQRLLLEGLRILDEGS